MYGRLVGMELVALVPAVVRTERACVMLAANGIA
jgi:hypothetical protein